MSGFFHTLEIAPILLKQKLLDGLEALGWGETLVGAISPLIGIASIVFIFSTLFALLSLVERKVLARIHNRYGPNRVGPGGILQPVADGIKMLTKQDIIPRSSDPVLHFLAPVLIMIPALLSLSIIPFGQNMVLIDLESGILLFFALGAVVEVAIFMAGWSSRSKFSLIGSMRAIAQVISYELPLILAATAVVMMTGSLSPTAIVAAQSGTHFGFIPHWFILTPWGAAAGLLFYIASLAESNRSPFDLPEGESEIVAGHMTEYSGFKYALFFMGEYMGLMAMSALMVTLFLGGWHAPLPMLEFIPSWAWFFLKFGAILLTTIWVRGTVPRFRIDQLMNTCWKVFIPMGLLILPATALSHYSGAYGAWLVTLVILGIPYLFYARLYNRIYRTPLRTYHFAE